MADRPSPTPYNALSIAVRNEERAFLLWSYLAVDAGRPEVRKAAERMAGEDSASSRSSVGRDAKPSTANAPSQALWCGADAAEMWVAAMLRTTAMRDATDGTALPAPAEFSDRSVRLAAGIPVQVCLTPTTTPGQMTEVHVAAHLDAAYRGLNEEAMTRLQDLPGRAVRRLALMSRPGL